MRPAAELVPNVEVDGLIVERHIEFDDLGCPRHVTDEAEVELVV